MHIGQWNHGGDGEPVHLEHAASYDLERNRFAEGLRGGGILLSQKENETDVLSLDERIMERIKGSCTHAFRRCRARPVHVEEEQWRQIM